MIAAKEILKIRRCELINDSCAADLMGIDMNLVSWHGSCLRSLIVSRTP